MRRTRRRLVRIGCLLMAAALLLGLLPQLVSRVDGARIVVETSPFVALGGVLARTTAGLGALLGLLFALPALLRRRWYCHYVCPSGLALDTVAGVSQRRNIPWARWPVLGRHAALLTLAGALLGYPVLLWLDPIALFAAPFTLAGSNEIESDTLAASVAAFIVVVCVVAGNVWCARLCPLGGFQDLLLAGRIALWRRLRSSRPRAPDTALPSIPARRALLTALLGGALASLGRRAGAARVDSAPLRPPGAIAEDAFTGLCVRCGNCASVCPTRIIHPDAGAAGLAGLLAPVLRFAPERYCLEGCKACTQACPSGALSALDLAAKRRYVIGEALVDTDLCLLILGRRECDVCARACPYDAIEIIWDEAQYVAYPQVDYQRCNGCGACQIACPTEEVKAIAVWPLLDGQRERIGKT
jgi:ferredoxin-type protein NapF